MSTPTTRPGRRPSDYRPKASVLAARQREAQIAAQEAQRIRAAAALSEASNPAPVDEKEMLKERLSETRLDPKSATAILAFLAIFFVGLVIGSIVMFFSNMMLPATVALAIAGVALVGLSLWVKNRYSALVNEFGKEVTVETLRSIANENKASNSS